MRATAALLVAAALITATTTPALARPRPAGHHHKSNFEANKTFGLGIMLGTPTGLSGKYFLGPDTAIDFGLGVSYCCYHGRHGIHLHGDYLWHPLSLVSADAFELPLYFGVGLRFYSFSHDPDYDHGEALGVRVPVGISFDFNNVPIDIFVEVAFVFDFLFGYDCADCGAFGADFQGAFGFRYYFS
jgi:hypothetical protein